MSKEEMRRARVVRDIKKLRKRIVRQYQGGRTKTAEEIVREIRDSA